MLGPGCGHTHTAEKCRGQEIFKLHGMQMLADPRPRLRHPLTRTHNNPDWGASCPGPPWLTLHTMGYHTCLTWRLKTRGWEWHVSCPQCHTGGVQESQESLDRSHTGRADRRLPTAEQSSRRGQRADRHSSCPQAPAFYSEEQRALAQGARPVCCTKY